LKNSNNCLAIIPARGGSKRIPQKNIKYFCGQPIIKYAIDAAVASNCFEEIMVSTDDAYIAECAQSFGAKVPFLRSVETANDYAVLADVIEEVLAEYKKIGKEYEFFCCILATAPFVSSTRLHEAFELLKSSDADSVIPVVRFDYAIQRALKIENGRLAMIWPEFLNTRSQDLPSTYHDCGQFYWMRTTCFLEQKTLFAKNAMPFEIHPGEVQDIDTQQDWALAEIKYKILNNANCD
jgi:pseudaminic acid cytidylyltransferase